MLVGLSRKSMISSVLDRPPEQRMVASVALALMAVERGARIVRVHDVAATFDALSMWQTMRHTLSPEPTTHEQTVFWYRRHRGEVGKYPVTADFMLKLGWAAGRVFASAERETHVLIGKDTRVSGYMFESALEAGLVAAGARVTLLGPMPTPLWPC